MKMLMTMLVLAAMAAGLRAQDVRVQAAHTAFAVHPYVTRGNPTAARFWTPSMTALVSLDGAAKAADSFITRRNIDGGGEEHNPLARPFVHTTGLQVAATAALFGTELATAFVLHRMRHDHLARAVLVGGAVVNGLGAAFSYKHRVPGW
jgi:hypothetical protein